MEGANAWLRYARFRGCRSRRFIVTLQFSIILLTGHSIMPDAVVSKARFSITGEANDHRKLVYRKRAIC